MPIREKVRESNIECQENERVITVIATGIMNYLYILIFQHNYVDKRR